MDKKQRSKLTAKGSIILRAQYNQKGYWQISYRTQKGGWAAFNLSRFDSKEICEIEIKSICSNPKSNFIMEE